jgi:membrane-bound lytic murein transglycosylase D
MKFLLVSMLLAPALSSAQAQGAEDSGFEKTALDHEGEGSLWDYIEVLDGEVPSEQAVEESEEISHERTEELRFLGEGSQALQTALDWYTDPLATASADPYFLDELDLTAYDLPIQANDEVVRWMNYFLGRGRGYYEKWIGRSGRYQPLISKRLAEEQVPQDLFYLAMVESGFSTHAYSKASAVGLWQFIQSTGAMYGLRVDWWVDERRDPVKATDAAARHLKDLHDDLGDWALAMSAYNAGPGRVKSAIRRGKSRDFWELSRKRLLPTETRNYVPKIYAAAIIGHDLERYGFVDLKMEPPLRQESVEISASTPVVGMAQCAGLDEKAFRVFNPMIRRFSTPPTPAKTLVRIPTEAQASFSACVAKMPKEDRVAFQRHRVRRGETLASIASKYHVPVTQIVRYNRIRNANRIYVGQDLVIPGPGDASGGAPPDSASGKGSSSSKASASRSKTGTKTSHVVKRGESLDAIAQKYKVSRNELIAWNKIKNPDLVQVGQKLVLYGVTVPVKELTVIVRRGDTLSELASKHGVLVADLRRWNHLKTDAIRVDQKLTLYSGGSGWIVYTVKRGDSLGAIATRYGCSVSELQNWNGVRGSTIHPGQSLKIRP